MLSTLDIACLYLSLYVLEGKKGGNEKIKRKDQTKRNFCIYQQHLTGLCRRAIRADT